MVYFNIKKIEIRRQKSGEAQASPVAEAPPPLYTDKKSLLANINLK